jgi:hypothetical protein
MDGSPLCRRHPSKGASMNVKMQKAWLIVQEVLGEPTQEDFNIFMLTWALAIQATKGETNHLTSHF